MKRRKEKEGEREKNEERKTKRKPVSLCKDVCRGMKIQQGRRRRRGRIADDHTPIQSSPISREKEKTRGRSREKGKKEEKKKGRKGDFSLSLSPSLSCMNEERKKREGRERKDPARKT